MARVPTSRGGRSGRGASGKNRPASRPPGRPTKGRAKSKGRRSVDLDWLEVEEAPRADLPDARKRARKARLWRSFVWVSVVSLPIVLIGMIGMMASAPVGLGSAGAQSSDGRVVATSVLHAWLSDNPAPIPGAQVISWDGAETVRTRDIRPTSSRAEPYSITTEANRFTIGVREDPMNPADSTSGSGSAGTDSPVGEAGEAPVAEPGDTGEAGSGDEPVTTEPGETEEEAEIRRGRDIPEMWALTYQATVLVEIDSRGGVKPIAQPSVIPNAAPVTDGWEEVRPTWASLYDLNTPDPVKTAVSRWSVAYISHDPEELRLATGDPIATNRYFPFSGPDSITATVLGAGTADSGETAVVRVRLQPHWPGQPVPDDRRSRVPTAPPFDLDVLVMNAATGSPVVVAWGAAGTGADLQPYENAVIGERPSVTTTTAAPTTSTEPAPPPAQPEPAPPAPADTAPPADPPPAPAPENPDGA